MKYLTLILTIFCSGCIGEPSPYIFSSIGWEKRIQGSISEDWRSIGKVRLNETTLDAVGELYGRTEKFRVGEKNYSPDLQCYKIKDDYVIAFQSGPLGGWSIVTGLLISEKNEFHDQRCGQSEKIRELANSTKIKIGDSAKTVISLLGQPSFNQFDFLAYRYKKKSELTNSKNVIIPVDVTSGIEIGLDKEQVSWIRVYWQEST